MTEIICLANSDKYGGRCIAGISVQTGQWIRPVTNLADGRLPTNLTNIDNEPIKTLDKVNIPLSQKQGNGHEAENRLILAGSWTRNGRAEPSDLLSFTDTNLLHFHNKDWLNAIPFDYLESLPRHERRTLQIIHTNYFGCFISHGKWRGYILGKNSGLMLDCSITAPEIRKRLDNGENIPANCLVILSLSQPWSPKDSIGKKMCHRLIVGIIELK
jgi:hypothetical protein